MAGTGIHVAGVSCLAEPSVCHQEEIRGYPTLKAFGLQDPNASADAGGVVIRTDQTEDKIVAWLKNHYRSHFSSAVAAGAGAAAAASLAEAGRKEKEGEGAAMGREAAAAEEKGSGILSAGDLRRRRASDAFTSLRFAMDHDVFLGATELKEGALETFKNLLRALVLLFPGAERRKALNGLLGAIEPLEVMGIAEWEERVERHMGPLVRKEEGEGDYKWTLAQPDAGYTGGLWFLFHILTARSAMASAEDQDPRVQPPHVLRVVHGFVEHFFGCEECKRHFLGAYEEVKETWEPQGAKGAVLWIWDLHDKVNVRLSKPRWPSRGECPRCWKGSAPQYDALYETLIDAYDIRDPHLLSGGGAASSRAGEDEGETSKGQIVSHDFVFIGLLVLIVLGAAVWKLERKLSLGRRKKQGDGRLPMYGRVNLADNV